MKKKVEFRDVSYVIQKLRIFLLGHDRPSHSRDPAFVAPRTQSPPQMPISDKISHNYYHTRNPFCSRQPPLLGYLHDDDPKEIVGKGDTKKSPCGCADEDTSQRITPGPPHLWDGHNFYSRGF